MLLIDPHGFVAHSDIITLATSQQALIRMDTAPTSGTAAISLFQQNAHALKATRWWGCERMRSSAVAQHTKGSQT